MRMTNTLFCELATAMLPLVRVNSGDTMRERWDVLWAIVDAEKFDLRKAYNEGLNDNHIDTALRAIWATPHHCSE